MAGEMALVLKAANFLNQNVFTTGAKIQLSIESEILILQALEKNGYRKPFKLTGNHRKHMYDDINKWWKDGKDKNKYVAILQMRYDEFALLNEKISNNRIMTFFEFQCLVQLPTVYVPAGLADFPDPDYLTLLYAQADFETASFTSSKYVNSNAMFGMKCSVKRGPVWDVWPTGSNEGRTILSSDRGAAVAAVKALTTTPFARYSSLAKSIEDRLNWDTYNGIYYTTAANYISQVLGKNINGLSYSPDQWYADGWVTRLNQVTDNNGMSRIHVDGYATGSTTNKGGIIPGAGDLVTDPGEKKLNIIESITNKPLLKGVSNWILIAAGGVILFKDKIMRLIK